MTIQTANLIVRTLGPCRIALDRAAHGGLAHELSLSGCEVIDSAGRMPQGGRGKAAGFVACVSGDPAKTLAAALPRFAQMDALVVQTAHQDRSRIEPLLFKAGWRRHPGGMTLYDFPEWGHALPPFTFYQRTARTSLGVLGEGAEGDAAIARYAMAATHVRPGDHVLIDGIASAEGAAILMALSRAGSVTRVDARKGQGLVAADLGGIADNSIDLIVAIEPAAPQGWQARLDDYARVAKFDGRLIFGLFQPGGDESMPEDWATFAEEVGARFLPERRYDERPGGAGCYLHALDPEEAAPQGDWFILVAAANPLQGEGQADGYAHPAFADTDGPLPALVDFGAAYDNPYLYRAMVQMGERIGNEDMLSRLAECIAEDARPDSADRGAALAVLGYRILETRRADLAAAVLPAIADYAGQALGDDSPVHVRRWCISLAFLAGRLSELAGDRVAAKRFYRAAAEGDWARFSPLLATKAIAAAFYEARIHLGDGDVQTAEACFRAGFDAALKAAAFPHDTQMLADGRPLSFYLTELAEVIDMGSQCANALSHLPLWSRDPGLFWRQVDTRRFGLASWARDLEKENARLRGVG